MSNALSGGIHMYQYEYVKVSAEIGPIGAKISGDVNSLECYRDIINARAADGWRYIGYIPTKESIRGYIREMDLIFEKEV